MKQIFAFFISSLLFLNILPLTTLEAAFTIHEGKVMDADYMPTMSVEDHFNAGMYAMEMGNWKDAMYNFVIVSRYFPLSEYSQEALFYEGVAHYNLEEYDLANDAFSNYLKAKSHPRLFQEAIEYKLAIAEKFRGGARRRLFGIKRLPKWGGGKDLSLQIYDEVIAAMPSHDIAAQAFYSKGLLHWSNREYRECVECFQMITKRFPKNELAPECYYMINRVYLDQCRYEFQNPDILAFAEINLRRFKENFPKEERIADVETMCRAIREVYGKGIYDTGRFYQRIGKPKASAIYYRNAIRQFPDTYAAQCSRACLDALGCDISVTNEEFNSEDQNEDQTEEKIEWIP